jgi:hypothetical protein
LKDRRAEVKGIPVDELWKYVKGFAWSREYVVETKGFYSEQESNSERKKQRRISLSWPSVLMFYKLELPINAHDRVSKFDILSKNEDR